MAKELMEHVSIRKTQLMAHPNNPRKDIGDITELTQSIRKNGIMQNLTVMPIGDETNSKSEKYVILIGHRRFEAGKQAGLKEFPCNVVTGLSEREQLSIMLEENMQRTDLTILEQAKGFQMMLDLGETAESISKKTGFSKTTVKHRLNIAKLDEEIIKNNETREFQMTLTDYYELEKVGDIGKRNEILKNASSSSNLRWLVQNSIEAEKMQEIREEVLKSLRDRGINEAPKEMTDRVYDGTINRIGLFRIQPDYEPELSEMELCDGCFYYENCGWVYIIREKTEEELNPERTKEDIENEERAKVYEMFEKTEKKMKSERKSFIKGILDKEINEDFRGRLWNLIISNGVMVDWDKIYSFFSGKPTWNINEDIYDKYREKAESLDMQKQMLCIVESLLNNGITSYRNEYREKEAEKIIEFTGILEALGFSYENEEEYKVLFGTHEGFIMPDTGEAGTDIEDEYADGENMASETEKSSEEAAA